jgi:hypothetical protein
MTIYTLALGETRFLMDHHALDEVISTLTFLRGHEWPRYGTFRVSGLFFEYSADVHPGGDRPAGLVGLQPR